jgi:predicted membrane protein (TIGR00267 family)
MSDVTARLKQSLVASSGTIVFGMEDGTVSIFGLVFGVAATTSMSAAVLVAGASGAAAAAVSMMAGAYLDAETSRDQAVADKKHMAAADEASVAAILATRLAESKLTARQCAALAAAVRADPDAMDDLMRALEADPQAAVSPLVQALWMLVADFLSAAVPMLPFFLAPVPQARIASAIVTTMLLIALGIGRARIAKRSIVRTAAETVTIGIAAALAGVAIGLLVNSQVGS